MGCQQSTVALELDQDDVEVLKSTAESVVFAHAELLEALHFVTQLRSRQYQSMEQDGLVKKVLTDPFAVRNFADAPPNASSRSVVMLVADATATTRQKAAAKLDDQMAKKQLAHVKEKAERERSIVEGIEQPARDAVEAACRTIIVGLIVPQGDSSAQSRELAVVPGEQAAKRHESPRLIGVAGSASQARHYPSRSPARRAPRSPSRSVTPPRSRPQSPGRNAPSPGARGSATVEESSPLPRRDTMTPKNSSAETQKETEPTAPEPEPEGPSKARRSSTPNRKSPSKSPKQTSRKTSPSRGHEAKHTVGSALVFVRCADGVEYDLPEGEWTAVGDNDLYYSKQELLYFHPPSGCFYDGDSGMWYDPAQDKWLAEHELP